MKKQQRASDRSHCRALGSVEIVPGQRFGDTPIGAITADDFETVFKRLRGAASTMNKRRQTIIHLQRWGVKKGYLRGPWVDFTKGSDTTVKRKKGARRDRRLIPDRLDDDGRVIELGEEHRLLAVASVWFYNLIVAAVESCCRRGELLSLVWRDVGRDTLRIRAEKSKTGEARDIPISPRLRAVLDMVRNDPAGQPHGPDRFVFGDRIGQQVADPKKQWQGLVLRAFGHTPTWTKGKLSAESRALYRACDLRFHDLRHEGASRWLEAGWPLTHVQRLLGHTSVATTAIYLNVDTKQLLDTMKRFPGPERPALHKVAHEAPVSVGPVGNGTPAALGNVLVN
jgi:integrase